jgi:hypothetical protein
MWNVRSFWKFQLAPKLIPMEQVIRHSNGERVPVVLRLAQSGTDSGYTLEMSTGQECQPGTAHCYDPSRTALRGLPIGSIADCGS